MFCWRITKYDPKNRDFAGAYLVDTWTSYSDIGKKFDGKQLTYETYKIVEDAYIKAIDDFMNCASVDSFRIVALEKKLPIEQEKLYPARIIELSKNIKNDQVISKDIVLDLSRLILRDNVWCKLESNNMYIHFGYDFYMYIGSKNNCNQVILDIKKTGLFVEKYVSPYSEIDEG